MAMFISHSPADTQALGEKFGRAARHGWVIALSGDLGAGKTQFVKGLARGLDISARVHSPTFTLAAQYTGGRLDLFHLDLYRLDSPAQILSAGLEEFFQPDGVAVIEWAERMPPALQPATGWLRAQIEILNETDRKIIYDDPGA